MSSETGSHKEGHLTDTGYIAILLGREYHFHKHILLIISLMEKTTLNRYLQKTQKSIYPCYRENTKTQNTTENTIEGSKDFSEDFSQKKGLTEK